jgi:hypothetical protein
LLESVRHLRTRELEGQRPWERHLERALAALRWIRPPGEKDFLGESADPRKRIEHPEDPERNEGQPRVFFGLISSSNTLLKDPVKRDDLKVRFGAKAIEMETAGLADAAWLLGIGYLGVRGICDYCDANKNDEWQRYAAVAAAAYVRALLESIPGSLSAPRPARKGQKPARPVAPRPPQHPTGTGPSDPAAADIDVRRQPYRDRIRRTLEEKLEALGRDESQAPRMLDRVASALETRNAPRDEVGLEKAIADHLLDVRDIQAIPRLNKLYLDLCGERKEKPADLVADCMDLLFPLYFSWDVIERAARQLERQKLVLIEGAVSSMTGADFVLAVHDRGSPCFVQHAEGPRGKHAIRVDTPPIDEPSLEYDVCQILDHIVRQLGVSQDVRGTERVRGDITARIRRLCADLNGCLDSYKILHGRSLYCVVQKQEAEEDRRYWLRVFERLRELVPLLVLIELDPDAPAREAESRLGYCLLVRFQAGRHRSSS